MSARWLKLVLGLALTAVFLWLLASGVDFSALGTALAGLSLPFLLLALSFLAVDYATRVVRWWLMLRSLEPGLPFRSCAWPFLTSIAVNNVVPFRAGDALRIFGFSRELRSPAARVLGTVIIERVLDLLVLLGFFFLGLEYLPSGGFSAGFIQAATWLVGIIIALLLALLVVTPRLEGLLNSLLGRKAPTRKLWNLALKVGSQLLQAMALLRSGSRFLLLMALSIVIWSCEGAVFATVAAAIHSNASPLGPWFALGTGTLATLIPSSPGYIGTFDFFAALGLGAYGASPPTAAAFALAAHAVLWAPLTASGLVYLILRGRRIWAWRSGPAEAGEGG